MKIQNKATAIMTLFGLVIVTLLSLGYDIQNHRNTLDKEIKNINDASQEIAQRVESHLKEKASLAITLSSAPLIKDALLKSNSEFALLTKENRKEKIENRNRKWKKTTDINTPFIQAHMTNAVAEHLSYQKILIPGVYGEIFLTNRYGVMIATTGKVTSLAHAHKYWWKGAYENGKGKIFLDDHGFDASVGGYMLGVVVPIRDGNDIIGILKCNVNLLGPLTNIVKDYNQRNPGNLKIIRTEGLIVSEYGVSPLSIKANKDLVEALRLKEATTIAIAENSKKQLVAICPIRITMGSEKYGFGGSQASIDHIKGNTGDAWHVVTSLLAEEAVETTRETTQLIIITGIIFTVLAAAVAMLLGKWAAKPIVGLSRTAQDIGEGHLDARAEVLSNDEIGALSKSLNRMAENLQNTMASRDELIREVVKRQKSEDGVQTLLHSIPVGILLIDSETHEIVSANPKACLMFEAPFEHFVGSQCHNLICSIEKGKCPITDLGQSMDNEECELLNTHGEIVPILKTVIPVTIEDRQLLIECFVDITDRKKGEEKFRQHEKLQGVIEMAGGVCHELNQPMQSISGYSELLMLDLKDDNPFYDKITSIKLQIERMGHITKKLMKITKYETTDYLEGKIIDIDKAAT